MLPLHAGHSNGESLVILALAVVIVGTAFALTREGWSRVGSLVAVAVLAGGSRLGLGASGVHEHGTVHLFAHGLELSVVAVVALAGYYALFDVRTATSADD